ncbi:MAG: recombinase RecT [Alkaliphilus sp.]
MSNLKLVKKDVIDVVAVRVEEFRKSGEIHFPENYSPQNAMKSAWLHLQDIKDKNGKAALETCRQDTIANALLDMVIQGLSPNKKQCYFVVYGKTLTLMRSYFGTVAITKRLAGVRNVVANCIYEGDEFEYKLNLDTGMMEITKHNQNFENIDNSKIKGVYAIVVTDDQQPNYTEIMNIEQVRKAWGQGATKGKSPAHMSFADQMAKKTVINRACKMFANTSNDSDLIIESFNRTTENEYQTDQTVEQEVGKEIKSKANKKAMSFPKDEVQDVEYKPVKETSKNEVSEKLEGMCFEQMDDFDELGDIEAPF